MFSGMNSGSPLCILNGTGFGISPLGFGKTPDLQIVENIPCER